jgi:hypothetical protein
MGIRLRSGARTACSGRDGENARTSPRCIRRRSSSSPLVTTSHSWSPTAPSYVPRAATATRRRTVSAQSRCDNWAGWTGNPQRAPRVGIRDSVDRRPSRSRQLSARRPRPLRVRAHYRGLQRHCRSRRRSIRFRGPLGRLRAEAGDAGLLVRRSHRVAGSTRTPRQPLHHNTGCLQCSDSCSAGHPHRGPSPKLSEYLCWTVSGGAPRGWAGGGGVPVGRVPSPTGAGAGGSGAGPFVIAPGR